MQKKGIALAASAYLIWGMFPWFFKTLQTVPAIEILLNRIAWSLVLLLIILLWRGEWTWLKTSLRQPKLMATMLLSALLLSGNWLLYIWAVNANHVLETSLGYFMTPLINILLGRLFLHERLRSGQQIAIACAALGVVWMTWQVGQLPWIALTLAVSFGTYGLLRKISPLGALEGLSVETALLFPAAFAYLIWLSVHGQNSLFNASLDIQFLLILCGPVTAIPLLLFAAGARRIPLTTLGFLQYFAPSVQFIQGVWLFHEPLDQAKLLGFAAIWLGLILYSAESLWFGLRPTPAKLSTQK